MAKPRTLTARQLNGLSGVRRGARRKCDERSGGVGSWFVKMQRFEIFTAGEADAIAADCAADLSISRAQIAMFVMRKRLIRALRLFSQCVRNTMHQAAQLRKQQGENQQESGEQGATHASHFNQET